MKAKWVTFILVIVVISVTFIAGSNFFAKGPQKNEYKFYHEDNKCSDNEDGFCTHLPLVSIDTGGQKIPGANLEKDTIISSISIVDNKNGGNHLTDKQDLTTKANIRYRGNSSLLFDKKGYLLNFVNDDGTENKQKVMGMAKHDEWVLHGPFIDKTLMRNYLWYHIAGEIMNDAPDSRFCELFVDGKYQGVYLMVESASRGDTSRMQIKKYDDGKSYTPYIVRLDRYDENDWGTINNFSRYAYIIGNTTTIGYNIVYPGQDKVTDELKRYIETDFSKFEKKLYSFDYDTHLYGYENFIDIDSFVNYYILNEFSQNYDAGRYSTYLYKDVRGKYGIYVWDFNSADNNYEFETNVDDFRLQVTNWYSMLMRDEDFTQRIIDRYRYLRNHSLNEEYLLNYIDAIIDYLGPAVDRNFEVWGYTFDGLKAKYTVLQNSIPSYEAAIEQLKGHIKERGKFLDEYIDTIKQFSSESKVKKYNH